MAFEFEDGIDTIKKYVYDTISERTMTLGNSITSIIKHAKKNDPDYIIINLDVHDDGEVGWNFIRMNIIEGLEKRFRGRITATRYLPNHIPLTVWEEVRKGDGCDYPYVKLIFNKEE